MHKSSQAGSAEGSTKWILPHRGILGVVVLKFNKTRRGFGLPARATKASETRVVHCSGHPFQYYHSPLLLNFSEETDTHHDTP